MVSETREATRGERLSVEGNPERRPFRRPDGQSREGNTKAQKGVGRADDLRARVETLLLLKQVAHAGLRLTEGDALRR